MAPCGWSLGTCGASASVRALHTHICSHAPISLIGDPPAFFSSSNGACHDLGALVTLLISRYFYHRQLGTQRPLEALCTVFSMWKPLHFLLTSKVPILLQQGQRNSAMEEVAFTPNPGWVGALGTLMRLVVFPPVSGSLAMTLPNSLPTQKQQ